MTQLLKQPFETVESEPADKYWTLEEFENLVDRGVLDHQHVQLISGRIVQMPPQREKHSIAIENAVEYLAPIFKGFRLRPQLPLRLLGDSEPEPDIAIVAGKRDRTEKFHPSTAYLIIEVSDSTLRFDRDEKMRIYAANSIREYWILNLVDNCIEVHRQPDLATKQYKVISVHRAGEPIVPLALPIVSIDPVELLP